MLSFVRNVRRVTKVLSCLEIADVRSTKRHEATRMHFGVSLRDFVDRFTASTSTP